MIINASNLHIGGGVQVAASFIHELTAITQTSYKPTIIISNEVDRNRAESIRSTAEQRINCEVSDTFGIRSFWKNTKLFTGKNKCVFTIFGPFYAIPFKTISIVGFAQAWIIEPRNECYALITIRQRISLKIKFWIQAQFFKLSDVIVVELEHVKKGLVKELGINPNRIHVVRNCISGIYKDRSLWQPVKLPITRCDVKLGFLGRNYLHKNTSIFPAIALTLIEKYSIIAKFYVTFSEQEWNACSADFKLACVNVGVLTANQCPSFYEAMDAVVFPSLLECFSATPLETMAMGKPLFASDRPFNKDVCGDHAHYFDPLAPDTAARAIATVFTHGGSDPASLRAAREHAINFSNPKERAEKYLALLMQCAKQPNN